MPELHEDTTSSWTTLANDEPAPGSGAVVIAWQHWRADQDAWIAWRGNAAERRLGVTLDAGVDPDALSSGLEHVDLVIIRVPTFTDGRVFSIARLLRERHGFRGELRASGDFLADQVAYLERCGFDSFASPNDPWTSNAEFSGYYQKATSEPRSTAFIRAARRALTND